MSAAHCIIQLKIFSISDVSRPFPLGSLVSPPWLLLMEYRHRDEENTNSIILLVVPSDQGASVFSWREGEGALLLCCESIKDTKTCTCQLFWKVWNEVRRKSAQIWPLPFEPYWTTAFTGVWTSSCLLNTKHIWFFTTLLSPWYAVRCVVDSVLTWQFLMGLLQFSAFTCHGS